MVKNSPQEPSLSVMSVGVRDIVSFVYREGGLGSHSGYDLSGNDKSLHSRFIKSFINKFPDKEYKSEVWLKTDFEDNNINMKISGRADIILSNLSDIPEVIEIKGIYSKNNSFPDSPDNLHLAQAKIYAYILGNSFNYENKDFKVTVCYVGAWNFKAKYFEYIFNFNDLKKFFTTTCKHFIDYYKDYNGYKLLRNKSILELKFPYSLLRTGQKNFMKIVLDSIKSKKPVLIQAPTGTGKTISTLYPAIKSIPHNISDYIFYLTAKNSTQEVVKKSLSDMRKQGLIIKSIRIIAKEKQCLCKDIYCDTNICPYATGYYNKSKIALREMINFDFIDFEVINSIAVKYNVCPFEISLDAALFCDIIICDYNYFFDPRVMLERFCLNDLLRLTVLIDEAHNLPFRTNEMHSIDLKYSDFSKLYEMKFYLTDKTQDLIEKIKDYFDNLSTIFISDQTENLLFDKSISENQYFKSGNICASRKLPKEFLRLLNEFVSGAVDNFERLENPEQKKIFTSFFFDSKYFLRISTEFFNDSYITYISKNAKEILFSLRCLDSSEMITRKSNGKNSLSFFSATLQPIDYFKKILYNSKITGDEIEYSLFPSPFPPENLLVRIFNKISVKYTNRRETLFKVKDIISIATGVKKGNYIVFCPSFEYMDWLFPLFEGKSEFSNFKIIRQKKEMNEFERESFLSDFETVSKKSLIAFAVLGGVFSEGIDLVGEYLSGVIIIGVGIPQNDVYNEILKDYYSNLFGNGYDFAYRFPGFNKILQASGRVIRTENDRGFVILIDERYQTPEYISLLPQEWDVAFSDSPDDIKDELLNFFTD